MAPALASCEGKLIYIQIFDEGSRADAEAWQKRLRSAGAKAPGIENVAATAVRRGRAPPPFVSAPTAIYHTSAEHACAVAMRGVDASLLPRPLGGGLVPTPGVIELWMPPKAAPSVPTQGPSQR